MVIRNWDKAFKFQSEMMRIMPLWVLFPVLLVYYWTEENLGRIASFLGKPVCLDRLTIEVERISFARVLIEIDITQKLPEELYIAKLDGTELVQTIENGFLATIRYVSNGVMKKALAQRRRS